MRMANPNYYRRFNQAAITTVMRRHYGRMETAFVPGKSGGTEIVTGLFASH
jgi:hypothetical protein